MTIDLSHSYRSQSDSHPSTNSGASVDELYSWLVALFVQVKRPAHVEGNSDEAMRVYADKLTEYNPVAVKRALEDWPETNDWWPTWHELAERLPPKGWTPNVRALPKPSGQEAFSARCARLGIDADTLVKIGAAHWGVLVREHNRLSDDGFRSAMHALEHRGVWRPYESHAMTRMQMADFLQAMASLRDESAPCWAREALLRIGGDIEKRLERAS